MKPIKKQLVEGFETHSEQIIKGLHELVEVLTPKNPMDDPKFVKSLDEWSKPLPRHLKLVSKD